VNSVHEAIVFLGLDLVRNLILGAHAFAALRPPPSVTGFSMEALMAHSVLTAKVAQKILKQPAAAAEAFTAGLLHDVGMLIALNALPQRFEAAVQATRLGCPLVQAELEFVGVEHPRLGGYLLGTWGLPRRIVEAVAHHDAPQSIPQPQFDVLAAVYVANILVEPLQPSPLGSTTPSDLDMAYLKALQVDDQVESWRALAAREHAGQS
jgi:HD-like signal output (HDOD) protein